MNKRLNKYIEENKHLEDLVPFEYNHKNPTEYIKRYFELGMPATHYKNGGIQCYYYKNRSFIDLYFLTKAAFPEVTMNELAYILTYKLCQVSDDSKKLVTAIKCPNIKKVVWKNYERMWRSFTTKGSRSSYGSASTVGSDGLSWNSLLSMAEKYIKLQNKLNNG